MVSYDGVFHLSPLTPPALKISINPDTSTDNPPTQYISQDILVTLENAGLEDAQQVLVSLGTSQMGQEITWSTPQTVTVLAGETTPVRFPWTPDADGVWYAQVQADLVEPEVTDSMPDNTYQTIIVQPAQGTDLEKEISAFGVVSPWQIVLLVISIVVTAGSAVWVLAHSLTQKTSIKQPISGKIDIRTK